MMKMKLFYEKNSQRCFLMTLLNAFFVIVFGLVIYYSALLPIKNANYKEDEIQMLDDRATLNQMATDAKLLHNFDNGDQYSINNYYEYYLRTLLKYNYENSSYDLDEDIEKYNEKKDTFKPFIDIEVNGNVVNDDFLGNFYTQYIVDKKDSNNNLVIDFSNTNPKDYFYYEILDIDNEGAKFFKDTSGEYPYFKDDVRKALYSYNFLKLVDDDYYQIDKEFFQFFVQKYNISGEFLLKCDNYATLLERHNSIYQTLLNYDTMSTFVSYGISLIVITLIIPLFTKYHRNPGELILKRAFIKDSEEKEEVTIVSLLIRFAYGIIKYLFAGFIISLFINLTVSFVVPVFTIGAFSVSLFVLTIISLLVNSISLSISKIRGDNKNLECLISRTRVFVVEKEYNKEQ